MPVIINGDIVDAPSLGEATAVASLATRSMDARIQTLYAEDADWATILSTLSEDESSVAEERREFLLGFGLTAFAQATFPLWAQHPAAAGLRVHLANGLYVNALTDRLLGGWSSRNAA